MPKQKMPTDIQTHIYRIRGQQVMLDDELSGLYRVETRSLVQAVRRNPLRFPRDFVFQLSPLELKILRSQSVISSWGGRRYLPYAFTEEGVAMLSSVLRSARAALVNVAIMRAFVRLRHALMHDRDLIRRVEKMEGKIGLIETDVRLMLQDIRELRSPSQIPSKPLPTIKGFDKD